LGTDERVFDHLSIDAKMKFIPWLRPLKNETIKKYSLRMGEKIQHPSPVLLGVSFGGMIGIEIAKQIPLAKLIIVSSIKTANELPGWMKLTGKFQLHKILPTRSYKITERYDNRRLGISNEEERKLVNAYREKMDPVYYNWAVLQVLNWKNNWYPADIVHIHGDHDKIFPVKNLDPTHIIRGGSHIMMLNKAEEVSQCINSVL
jgi:pimeloyl-ACP methyl ester carboxylesterase